jgi:vitamin B12 transporter
MCIRRFAAISFIGLACSESCLAQDDVVVVTATRVPKRFAELVNDVTVVTRDEIDRAGQSSLANLLQAVPGVEVTQAGGFGGAAQVFLRGANAGHTLFLVDGMRVGSASTGLTAIEQLPLEQIERIEVLRGPASSLYGSDAIGGVVQIFTRSGRGNPGANAYAGSGTYDTAELGAGYGYERERNRFALQAGAISTSGITAVRNPASSSFNPDADGYRNVNATGQFARRLGGEDEIDVRVFHSEGEKHFDSTPRTFDQRLTEDLTAVSAFARNQIARYWRSNLTVGSSLDDLTSFQSPTSFDVFKTYQRQATWQNDFATPFGLVIGALEHLGEHLSSTTAFPVKDRSVNSQFAAYQASLDRHQLQASLRRDDNSQFGGHRTWQLGYGFRFTPRTRAWANVGTAYKAPTFNQLYFPGFGNPSLRPEQSRGYEIGSQFSAQGWQIGAVYYHSGIDNLIVNAGVPLAPSNIDKADIRGVTLTGKAETRGGAAIAGSLDLQEPEDGATHQLLPRRARRHASLAASVPAYAGRASAELIASSERFNDSANAQRMSGYGVLNLAYEQVLRKEWKWFARINNATDKRYELIRDFNVPGRTFFFGARYEEKGF